MPNDLLTWFNRGNPVSRFKLFFAPLALSSKAADAFKFVKGKAWILDIALLTGG